MSIFNFSKANCKNCYKCLRACPVKAIKFKNEQAEIVEERCIGCGQCLIVCPQDARNIKSDLEDIKSVISNKKRVIATIAPSFPGAFDMLNSGQVVTALKSLGFYKVEETAIGAEVVSHLYKEYIKEKKPKNFIATCCPSANYLIERYFPALTKYMAPIVSPMLAHGKMLKHTYGMDSYVVFIGPCTAKKIEAENFQHQGTINGILTFDELLKWLEEENISLKDLDSQPFDQESHRDGCGFPIEGGVIKSFIDHPEKFPYEIIKVDGIDQCMEVFQSMENNDINGVCLEINVCRGSCVGGPGMQKNERDFFKRKRKVKDYVRNKKKNSVEEGWEPQENLHFSKLFFDRQIQREKASEEEIKNILRQMGKYEKEDELNCGGCGYNTCRQKAQAVLEGMAEVNMCLPFMRGKAESLTNVIFENSPNIIIILDEDMKVKEFNPRAEETFHIKAEEIKGQPISMIIDNIDFFMVKENKEDLLAQKVSYPQYDVVLLQSILYLQRENIMLAIMTDITSEERHEEELNKVKENTLDVAQKVIEKQMRVAQEIASLLGETTAETKVTLTRLKEVVIGEKGDGK